LRTLVKNPCRNTLRNEALGSTVPAGDEPPEGLERMSEIPT
jgi:hypothetical protein